MFELKEFPLYAGGVAAGVVVRSFERFVYPIFVENTQKSEQTLPPYTNTAFHLLPL